MMKSIKEKAHEIGWQYTKHYDPIACKQEWCEMAAREGANYVLEHLSMTIVVSEDSHLRDNLKIMIEQLKK